MATMNGARGTRTKFVFGAVKCDVILHGTVAEAPKLKDYATAGPNGRPLRRVERAVRAEVADTPVGETVAVEERARPLKVSGVEVEPVATHEPAPAPVTNGSPPVPEAWRDTGPGRFAAVLIEEPGEGETEEDMPALLPENLRRGLRLEDGTFVDLTAELADIEAKSKLETMEVISTLDVGQVPRNRVQGSYYVSFEPVRDGDGNPGVLRALYEGMRKSRRAPVVKWTAKTKQSLGVMTVNAKTGTLELLKLAFAEDVRAPGAKQLAHLQAKVYVEEVDAFAELLLAYSETRSEGLDAVRDDARELREELEERAREGSVGDFVVPPVPETPEGDLLDALSASLDAVRS